jgi:hypothetical protein
MIRANFNPLAPRSGTVPRQKLAPISALDAAAAVTFAVGTGAAGSLISSWFWEKAVKPRLKNKDEVKKPKFNTFGICLETKEELIVQIKRKKTVRLYRLK